MTKIIKFEREGCMPCRKLDKILQSIGVEVEHKNIDLEDCEKEIQEYGIMSTPTLVKISDNGFEKLTGIQHSIGKFKEFLEV